jgi:hypothetical protein
VTTFLKRGCSHERKACPSHADSRPPTSRNGPEPLQSSICFPYVFDAKKTEQTARGTRSEYGHHTTIALGLRLRSRFGLIAASVLL